MNLKDFLECVDYKITEGSDFGWNCFGDNAYCLSYWNQDHDGHSMSAIFDTKTQVVYAVEVCDYTNQRAYRYINPEFKNSHDTESDSRNVDNTAWDDVKWVDLELFEDWKEKACAIKQGVEYDTRVKIPLDLDKEDFYELMKQAHEQDLTLNELVEKILLDLVNNQPTVEKPKKNKKSKKKKK